MPVRSHSLESKHSVLTFILADRRWCSILLSRMTSDLLGYFLFFQTVLNHCFFFFQLHWFFILVHIQGYKHLSDHKKKKNNKRPTINNILSSEDIHFVSVIPHGGLPHCMPKQLLVRQIFLVGLSKSNQRLRKFLTFSQKSAC